MVPLLAPVMTENVARVFAATTPTAVAGWGALQFHTNTDPPVAPPSTVTLTFVLPIDGGAPSMPTSAICAGVAARGEPVVLESNTRVARTGVRPEASPRHCPSTSSTTSAATVGERQMPLAPTAITALNDDDGAFGKGAFKAVPPHAPSDSVPSLVAPSTV